MNAIPGSHLPMDLFSMTIVFIAEPTCFHLAMYPTVSKGVIK